MVNLRAVLATAGHRLIPFFLVAALFTTSTIAASSAFVSDTESISFSINIPQDDNSTELYFSISGPSKCSYLAVGMGSDEMKGSLMFLIYKDSSGKNVTLSPRISFGHVEPSYTSDVQVTLLSGTRITGNTTIVNAKCSNCRAWKTGSLDATKTNAHFIWANGGVGEIKSNDKNAATKRHGSYGAFTIDLTKAVGAAQPVTPANASSAGSSQTSEEADHDFASGGHAIVMIFVFIGLMPLAVMILRILNSPRWHGIAQALSAALALVGVALGLKIGTMYNRSKRFNSAHQIIGLIVMVAMVGQFIIGFLHHRKYKMTQATTKLAPIHVWLGRLVILLGIINGFTGFPLALNSRFNLALLGVLLAAIIVSGPIVFWRWRRNTQKAKTSDATKLSTGGGYQAEPWRSEENQSGVHLQQLNYPPPPRYNNIR